jgi:hypothetical protein
MLDLHCKMSWAHTMHRKYFYFNYNLFVWYHNPVQTMTSSASLRYWFLSIVFLFFAWIPRIFRHHWIISKDHVFRLSVLTVFIYYFYAWVHFICSEAYPSHFRIPAFTTLIRCDSSYSWYNSEFYPFNQNASSLVLLSVFYSCFFEDL